MTLEAKALIRTIGIVSSFLLIVSMLVFLPVIAFPLLLLAAIAFLSYMTYGVVLLTLQCNEIKKKAQER